MPTILTVIVTFNGMKWLDKCLSSVKNSTIPSDIIIIDNGSTDGSVEYIKTNYPEAMLTQANANLGFGKANNIGLVHALTHNYEYVYLLNQDAWIEVDTLDKLIGVNKRNPMFGILSPLQENKSKTRLDYNFAKCCPDTLLSDALCSTRYAEVYETDFVMAAHWLISKKCLEVVGGFSPSFYHYGEDCNYVDRVKYYGMKIGIVPTATGVHDRENRFVTIESKRKKFYTDNLVTLSNPNISNRRIRVLGRCLIWACKEKELPNGKLLWNVFNTMGAINKNRKISMRRCAFL